MLPCRRCYADADFDAAFALRDATPPLLPLFSLLFSFLRYCFRHYAIIFRYYAVYMLLMLFADAMPCFRHADDFRLSPSCFRLYFRCLLFAMLFFASSRDEFSR